MDTDNDKGLFGSDLDDEQKTDSANRARNRTVMLTPEVTGQVRAMLAEQASDGSAEELVTSTYTPAGFEAGEDSAPPEPQFQQSGSLNDIPQVHHQESLLQSPPQDVSASDSQVSHSGVQGGEQDLGLGQPIYTQNIDRPEDTLFSKPEVQVETPAPQVQQHVQPQAVHQENVINSHNLQNEPLRNDAVNFRQSGVYSSVPVESGHHFIPTPMLSSTDDLSPVVGFLVSFDQDKSGEVFELRQGRWIVSSEPTGGGNYIIVVDDSVSPLHAILRVTESGEIQLLDQLSEHGTKISRVNGEQEELTGTLSSIAHGDIVSFGERTFTVCLIARREEEQEQKEVDAELNKDEDDISAIIEAADKEEEK